MKKMSTFDIKIKKTDGKYFEKDSKNVFINVVSTFKKIV